MADQQELRGPRIRPSERSRSIEYAIRDLIVYAKRVGREVIYLNIGDPVKFGFDTPDHVKREMVKAIEEGLNFYSESEGLPELREAIAERESKRNKNSIENKDVIVTNGISEGICMLMGSLVEPGNEVLVPGPSYPPYISQVKFFGGAPVEYKTVEESGWDPDIDDLRSKITERTRAIVVINPNNPSGSVYDSSTLKQICSIVAENRLLLISDEIYDEITYETPFRSVSTLSEEIPVVGLNGFSKSSLMTGWRLGYLYFKGPNGSLDELKEAVARQARLRLCANTPVQKAAVAALQGPRGYVGEMVSELKKRRDYSWKRVNEIDGLSSSKPQGAFYLFPKIENSSGPWSSDTDFVLDVLKKTAVLLVPGSGFGNEYGRGHFRVVFLPPADTLEVAFGRLEEFMSSAKPVK